MRNKTTSTAIIVLLLIIMGCGALVPAIRSAREYIVETDLTKDKIYDKTLSFVAHAYNNPNYVFQLQNREGGEVVVHAIYEVPITKSQIGYIFTIKMKDGAAKISFIAKEEVMDVYLEKLTKHFELMRMQYDLYLKEKDDF